MGDCCGFACAEHIRGGETAPRYCAGPIRVGLPGGLEVLSLVSGHVSAAGVLAGCRQQVEASGSRGGVSRRSAIHVPAQGARRQLGDLVVGAAGLRLVHEAKAGASHCSAGGGDFRSCSPARRKGLSTRDVLVPLPREEGKIGSDIEEPGEADYDGRQSNAAAPRHSVRREATRPQYAAGDRHDFQPFLSTSQRRPLFSMDREESVPLHATTSGTPPTALSARTLVSRVLRESRLPAACADRWRCIIAPAGGRLVARLHAEPAYVGRLRAAVSRGISPGRRVAFGRHVGDRPSDGRGGGLSLGRSADGGHGGPCIRSAGRHRSHPAARSGHAGPMADHAGGVAAHPQGDWATRCSWSACFDQYPFSLACALMGIQQVMMKLLDDRPMVEALMERCAEYAVAYGSALAEAGADMLSGGDSPAGLDRAAAVSRGGPAVSSGASCRLESAGLRARFAAHLRQRHANPGRHGRLGRRRARTGSSGRCRHGMSRARTGAWPFGAIWIRSGCWPEAPRRRFARQRRPHLRTVDACGHKRWVVSSGCTLAPETPSANLQAMLDTARNEVAADTSRIFIFGRNRHEQRILWRSCRWSRLGVDPAHCRLYQQSACERRRDLRSRLEQARQRAAEAGLADAALYDDLDKALRHPGVDIVSICTPQHVHCQQVLAAAEAGKHMLIEKPIGISLEELRAMRQAVRQAGVRNGRRLRPALEPPVSNAQSPAGRQCLGQAPTTSRPIISATTAVGGRAGTTPGPLPKG